MGFALSKLSWLSRGRNSVSRGGHPALRRADAHPDAPARTPIFASRDFGGIDIFPRTVPAQPQSSEPIDAAQQSAATPLAEVPQVPVFVPDTAEEFSPAPAPAATEPLTLADLTARLERGLARRERRTGGQQVLADMPVEQAVPVRAQVEDDADQALRAALGALRAMAERAR